MVLNETYFVITIHFRYFHTFSKTIHFFFLFGISKIVFIAITISFNEMPTLTAMECSSIPHFVHCIQDINRVPTLRGKIKKMFLYTHNQKCISGSNVLTMKERSLFESAR